MYGVHESVIKLFSNKQTAHQKSRNESHKFLAEKAIKKSQHKKTHQSQGLTNKMFFFIQIIKIGPVIDFTTMNYNQN